ncbi:UDP-GalNAc:beta-1,3-N-acetylgalactosaminyltransferase 2-like isoform X2 [Brevipalpus obovatus]|uniref:UDP-GalNAc:beta-1, 3-N-acetylgalactosaminyltransferase 2-like isoform X2 n=1 Tax=Brevipalpus obovatus TaxID=246614 RepID=UPI003D9E7AE8
MVFNHRENFENRQAIRQTWLNELELIHETMNFTIQPFFIIGNKDCDIPSELRRDANSCTRWELNATEDSKLEVHSLVKLEERTRINQNYLKKLYNGYTFRVHHDLFLLKIGIPKELTTQSPYILLRDISHQAFTLNMTLEPSKTGEKFTYYAFESEIHLQKNSIWHIHVELGEDWSLFHSNWKINWNPNLRLIEILRIYSDLNDYHSEGFTGENLPPIDLVMRAKYDRSQMLNHLNMSSELLRRHSENLIEIEEKLKIESQFNSDIIPMDSIETYNNLSWKLSLFMKRIVQDFEFDYLIKTDDDCILDLRKIIIALKDFYKTSDFWWGNFRKNLLIQIYGKWAESDYPCSVYPNFACGSGHLMSYSLVQWIARNSEFLYHFQGEDTSLGIWLASILPGYIQDQRWSCAEDIPHPGHFSRCQLRASEIKEYYYLEHEEKNSLPPFRKILR